MIKSGFTSTKNYISSLYDFLSSLTTKWVFYPQWSRVYYIKRSGSFFYMVDHYAILLFQKL